MARVTHVKKAQQRYEMVPVLDEAGQPVRTPVLDKIGHQKSSKRGLVFRTQSVEDKTRPLPLEVCDSCRLPIEIGTPYKWIQPKSGPYGGRKRSRHEACPNWQVWDYSSSLFARTAQLEHGFWESLGDEFETVEDVQNALNEMAEEARSLASEKEEAAENIESGFGHETEQSSELREIADQLNSWADDIEEADIPDLPEPDDVDCEACDGTGKTDEPDDDEPDAFLDCKECDGSGLVSSEKPSEEQLSEWRDEVRDAVSVVGECPV